MGEVRLSGNFILSGTGKIKRITRKLKVLKQLGNKLFVCGDRTIPEEIYTIPTDKRVVYARIDNNGSNLDDWVVVVFLKPKENEYDPKKDYNQQTNRDGTEEVFFLDSSGVTETFFLNSNIGGMPNNKIYTGNFSLSQVDVGENISIKVNSEDTQNFHQRDRNSYEARIFKDDTLINRLSGLRKPLYELRKIVEKDSTGEERQFFKEPYHKIKGLYFVRKYYQVGLPRAFRLIECQTFTRKETKDVYTEVFKEPPEGDDRRGNRDGKATRDFADRCAEPTDIICFLIAGEPYGAWMRGIAMGISWHRGWGSPCQFKAPPYPTFKASCSVIREAKPREIYCAKWIGSGYFDSLKIGNFVFEQTPPFGGKLIDSTTVRGKIGAIFEPDPKDLSYGSLDSVGSELVAVVGAAYLSSLKYPRELDTRDIEDPEIAEILNRWNVTSKEIFEKNYSRLTSHEALLDMGLFTQEGIRKTECEFPYPRKKDNEDNDRGDRDGPGPQYERRLNNQFIIEEYFIERNLVGLFSLPFKYMRISLTGNNYEEINSEIFEKLNQEHGLTVNPETYEFFIVKLNQQILKEDINLTKNKETIWEVEKYIFTLFDKLDKGKNSTWETENIKEKVFPLKNFDKIWSFSYYA